MYMQNDIVAAYAKGPHFKQVGIDPTARRAELEKVIALATSAMPKDVMRKLQKLSFAIAANDDDEAYLGQIRSEPMGPAGLEFRFPMSAWDTGRQDLDHVATQLVAAATLVARASTELREYGNFVRETAKEAIAPATGGIASMRVVSIGITPELSNVAMKTTVDVEMLGRRLTPCIERVTDLDLGTVEEKLSKLAATHVERRKAFAKLRVANTSGWIDDTACLILEEAGIEVAAMVERLEADDEVEFYFGGEEGYDLTGAVYWMDGTIKGFVEDRTRGAFFRLQTNELTIDGGQLPATIIASLVGRRLREVIDLRFIPINALIVDVREIDNLVFIDLEIGRSTIEEAISV